MKRVDLWYLYYNLRKFNIYMQEIEYVKIKHYNSSSIIVVLETESNPLEDITINSLRSHKGERDYSFI